MPEIRKPTGSITDEACRNIAKKRDTRSGPPVIMTVTGKAW